jgi:DNA-binding transcriptional MerR regulator/effector-binding domain-containing protein
MTASVTIGEFSRLTHLSVKTLHHYHEIGLLAPEGIDPSSGYRRYGTGQVQVALLIRRLRELDMPLAGIREVVLAPDTGVRDRALREHLDRMESELTRTRQVVSSLRSMLTTPYAELAVEHRHIPSRGVLAIADRVTRDEIGDWCAAAFPALSAAAAGLTINGVAGASFSNEFFTEDAGEVIAYLPVADDPRSQPHAAGPAASPPVGRVSRTELPAGDFAVAVHAGSFDDFDRTYGALGSHVAEHGAVAPGPIHELYLVGPDLTDDPQELRTEVCWPILREDPR